MQIDLPEELQVDLHEFKSLFEIVPKQTRYAMILIFGKEPAVLQKQARSVLPRNVLSQQRMKEKRRLNSRLGSPDYRASFIKEGIGFE